MSFNENKGYIYIISTLLYNSRKSIKIGSTCDYEKRYFNYKTYSHIPWEYIKVYEILDNNCNNCYEIDNLIQKEFEKDLINNPDGGVEWYNNSNNLIERIEKYLQKNFNINEVKRDKLYYKNFEIYKKLEKIDKDGKINMINNFVMEEFKFKKKITLKKPRIYQTNYIKLCFKILINLFSRCLMVSPTGSGKTFMFYKISKKILEEKRKHNKEAQVNIVILSPRLSINEQTVSLKNRNLLDKDNDFIKINGKDFKDSNIKYNRDIKNNKNINFIISSTYQSVKKLQKFIKDNKIEIDLVIFDECHFINSWYYDKKNDEKKDKEYYNSIDFILKDNEYIKRRLFCSATPYKDQRDNKGNYGECIEEVKVGELINQGYLCPIKTILKDYKDEISLSKIILQEIKCKNKKKTIIFCNTQVNCKSLFGQMKHIINKNNLNIKPHIYIGKNKNSNIDDINLDEKETDKNILDSFEKDDEISLIITCKKISMGYDYPKIDFVVFADPKCDKVEIAQCIGRGLRTTNDINKVCHVLLPINEEDLEDSKFKTVISYFQYMRNECNYEILSSNTWHNGNDNDNIIPKEGNKYGFDIECDFMDERLKTKIIDKYSVEKNKEENIINKNNNIILNTDLIKSKINNCIIKDNNLIISRKKYYRSVLNDIWISMDRETILKNTTFNFKETNENGNKGFKWDKNLKISIQDKNSNGSIIEIFKMVKLNNYKIDLSIKLNNGQNIEYKN